MGSSRITSMWKKFSIATERASEDKEDMSTNCQLVMAKQKGGEGAQNFITVQEGLLEIWDASKWKKHNANETLLEASIETQLNKKDWTDTKRASNIQKLFNFFKKCLYLYSFSICLHEVA